MERRRAKDALLLRGEGDELVGVGDELFEEDLHVGLLASVRRSDELIHDLDHLFGLITSLMTST